MAGILPGVEYARRRRFHGSSPSTKSPSAVEAAVVSGDSCTRRPAFCLHTSSRESHYSRHETNRAEDRDDPDEKLSRAAREAKERLDKRLRNHRKSDGVRRREVSKPENVHGFWSAQTSEPKRFYNENTPDLTQDGPNI